MEQQFTDLEMMIINLAAADEAKRLGDDMQDRQVPTPVALKALIAVIAIIAATALSDGVDGDEGLEALLSDIREAWMEVMRQKHSQGLSPLAIGNA